MDETEGLSWRQTFRVDTLAMFEHVMDSAQSPVILDHRPCKSCLHTGWGLVVVEWLIFLNCSSFFCFMKTSLWLVPIYGFHL